MLIDIIFTQSFLSRFDMENMVSIANSPRGRRLVVLEGDKKVNHAIALDMITNEVHCLKIALVDVPKKEKGWLKDLGYGNPAGFMLPETDRVDCVFPELETRFLYDPAFMFEKI